MIQKQIIKEIIKNNFILIYSGKNLNTYKHNTTGEYLTKYMNDNKYWIGNDTVKMHDLTPEDFIKRFS
jgi:hypothetical protein